MKVIGTITEETEGNRIVNPDYLGGTIVMLTGQETRTLSLLQEASQGHGWDWQRMRHQILEDEKMAEVFILIYQFVKAKFAVNKFKETIDELDKTLMTLEDSVDEGSG